jgi:type VI secretion system secreted protein VgrG
VQYRESDFNFVSRLMEEEGIYYYFKHTASGHKLILADNSSANADVPGDSEFVYDEVKGGVRDEPRICDWEKTQHWGSGKHTVRDYYFETPKTDLTAAEPILDSTQVGRVTHKLKVAGNDQFEVYDYPGGYTKSADGKRVVKLGLEQMESAQFLIRGQSNAFALVSGHRFALARHFNADGQYVLTSVTHSAAEGGFHTDSQGTSEDHYSNLFTCTPATLHFRPERVSTRPFVRGCQTARVVGPSGEEIYVDKYSRVKVQFHWDREGKNDGDSSCWIRVASFWAGKNWGAVHIPRIGQEVIVDFLEGDPDRPIIVGSVYNADNMPPNSLPGNKTQSGIKSRSSMGGGPANCNEIRFEDKMGSEQVLIHAEKNLDAEVEHDETRWVGNDRTTTIDHDDTTHIKHDQSLTVDNKRDATIASDDSETVGGKQTITVASNQSVMIGGSQTETIATNESHTTGASRTVSIAASDSLTVGATLSITAAGVISITTSGAVSITASAVSINSPIVTVAGVLQCTTLIAAAGVVSPVYTPGAGNIL